MTRPRPRLWPSRRARPTTRVGFFEGLRHGRFTGWTFDPDEPGRPLRVRLQGPGWSRELMAARNRADVRSAAPADHLCGFSLAAGGLDLQGEVHCSWADTDEPLPRSPWSRRAPRVFDVQGLRIGVDAPTPGLHQLSGYAYDPALPSLRPRLALKKGERLLAQAPACLYRDDLALADPLHGFELDGRLVPGLALIDAGRGLELARFEDLAA